MDFTWIVLILYKNDLIWQGSASRGSVLIL